jgi:hypothetical protein
MFWIKGSTESDDAVVASFHELKLNVPASVSSVTIMVDPVLKVEP